MRQITICTSQNVPVDYEVARTSDRIFAALIDVILFGVAYWLMLILVIYKLLDYHSMREFGMFLFPLLLFMAYQVIMDMFVGQTIGKRVLGLRAIRLDGRAMTFGDHTLRAAFYLIDCLFTVGFLAIVFTSVSAYGQRLGDMATNTTVIKTNPHTRFQLQDILAISTLSNYEPMFPQAANLREDDMILLKGVIARYREYRNPAHIDAMEACAKKIQEQLEIPYFNGTTEEFLGVILKDFIVLTR